MDTKKDEFTHLYSFVYPTDANIQMVVRVGTLQKCSVWKRYYPLLQLVNEWIVRHKLILTQPGQVIMTAVLYFMQTFCQPEYMTNYEKTLSTFQCEFSDILINHEAFNWLITKFCNASVLFGCVNDVTVYKTNSEFIKNSIQKGIVAAVGHADIDLQYRFLHAQMLPPVSLEVVNIMLQLHASPQVKPVVPTDKK